MTRGLAAFACCSALSCAWSGAGGEIQLPVLQKAPASTVSCGYPHAAPELSISVEGVSLNGAKIVLDPDPTGAPLHALLEQAVLEARGPEYRDWVAHASAGGHIDFCVTLRADRRVSMCDVEAVLALIQGENVFAAAQDSKGHALRVGLRQGLALPNDVRLKRAPYVWLDANGARLGKRVSAPFLPKEALRQLLGGRNAPIVLVASAETSWQSALETLAQAPEPFLALRWMAPMGDAETKVARSMRGAREGRCRFLPAVEP
jgi:hypothetical protein